MLFVTGTQVVRLNVSFLLLTCIKNLIGIILSTLKYTWASEKRRFAIWQRPILVYESGIDGGVYPGLFRMKTPESIGTSESCVSLKVAKKHVVFQSFYRRLLEISDYQYW